MELVVFIGAAIMVLVGALGVVLRSNPVHAALSMVLSLFGIAVLFVALSAHFLAAVQVIVYAGAIVVLFLFVIMLLGVDRAENLNIEPIRIQRPLAIIVSAGIVGLIAAAILQAEDAVRLRGNGIAIPDIADPDANVRELARSIFGDYVLAFELVTVLLLIAVVATVMMSRRLSKEELEVDQ
jgi:NADH-quinone oxidoreductase subunit J